MAGPTWARWVFALIFAVIGVHCALRLLHGHRASGAGLSRDDRTVTLAHLTMAAGMVAMFVPVATPIPPVWWACGFGAHTAWLGTGLVRTVAGGPPDAGVLAGRAHLLTHVLSGLVMTYLFAVMPADTFVAGVPHAGHLAASSSAFAVIGWLAAGYFLLNTVHSGVRVAAAPPPQRGEQPGRIDLSRGPTSRPACGLATPAGRVDLPLRLVMGLGMSYMLLGML